jgi:hypothetical protein
VESIVVARLDRTALIELVRRLLRARGIVLCDADAATTKRVRFFTTPPGSGCAFAMHGLFDRLMEALAAEQLEARGATIEVMAGRVTLAEVCRVVGDEVVRQDEEEEVADLVDEYDSANGLVEMMVELGPVTDGEVLYFRVDAAAARAEEDVAPAVVAPVDDEPWRRLRHPDGRRWAVRARPTGVDMEITDSDGDVVRRFRPHEHPRAAAALWASEQRADGFVDDAD